MEIYHSILKGMKIIFTALLVLGNLFSEQVWFGFDKTIALLGALGSLATVGAFVFLFLRDQNKEEQLNQLRSLAQSMSKQTRAVEQRLLQSVRPDLWKNVVSHNNYERTVKVQLNNRGEDARLLDFLIDSDTVVLDEINRHLPYNLLKGEDRYVFMLVTGPDPSIYSYKLWVTYEDKLKNKYRMLISGEGEKTIFSQAELIEES